MIAVARLIKSTPNVQSSELDEPEREQLRRVDPLREVDLAADLLLDALKDPKRALADPIVPKDRMATRATADLLATDAIHGPAKQKEELPQDKEKPKGALLDQGPVKSECGACCEKKPEPGKKPEPIPEKKPDGKLDPDPDNVVVTPDQIMILEPVNFALDKYDILPTSATILKGVGKALRNHPEIEKVRVEGHTDVRASIAYNQTLSENRVLSVVNWLVDKEGIDKKRLVGEGKGELQPLIPDAKTEAQHFKNRRVEFHIVNGIVVPNPANKNPSGPPAPAVPPPVDTPVPEPKPEPKLESACPAEKPAEPAPPAVTPPTDASTPPTDEVAGDPVTDAGKAGSGTATTGPATIGPVIAGPQKPAQDQAGGPAQEPKTGPSGPKGQVIDEEVEVKPPVVEAADGQVETPAAPPDDEGDASGADEPSGEAPADNPSLTKAPSEAAPPEPKPPVTKAPQTPQPLEATGSKDVIDQFAKMSPTQKALNYDKLGPTMDKAGQKEQQEQEKSVPVYHATIDDQSPLSAGKSLTGVGAKSKVPEEAGKVDVKTGQKGQLPTPAIKPLPKPAPFVGPKGLGVGWAKLPATAKPDDKARLLDKELATIKTKDAAVPSKVGPPPKVPLTKDANPALIAKASQQGIADADKAKFDAQQKLVKSPGEELVKPAKFDESHQIEALKKHTLEPPAGVAGVEEYKSLNLPGEVQAKFDEQQAAAMEASLAGAQDQISKATEQRDTEHQKALADADAKSKGLHEDAQKRQNDAVAEQRQKIHAQRQSTLKEQDAAVGNLHVQAKAEQAKVGSQIDKRVKSDEEKIRAEYASAEKEAAAKIKAGEQKADAEKKKKAVETKNQSWWQKATSAVGDFFEAIGAAVKAVFDALRAAVATIFNAVKALAGKIIDAAAKFVGGLIEVFGTFLKGAINALLASTFPKLAAKLNAYVDATVDLAKKSINKIADTLKKGVAFLCDVVVKVLDTILAVANGLIQMGLAFQQAAMTGDWGALAKKALMAILAAAGIEPAEFMAMIGTGEKTLDTLVKEPGKFVGHALDAAVGGFKSFSDHFDDHLQKGLVTWLTGQLGDIKIPEKLDGEGIFSIVLQVLGLSKPQLRQKAVRIIGEDNVERVEWVWGFITDLLKPSEGKDATGMAGLWGQIESSVGNLWDDVIGGVKDWLMTRIVMTAIAKLASMFNPIGAVVQLVMTVWNLYKWFQENVKRIYGVITAWVASLADIAGGKIDGAAKKIEEALAGLVPVTISLLANLVGIGGIAKKVREVITKVQTKIDKGIDKFVDRVKGLFKGGSKDKTKDADKDKKDAEPDLSGSWAASESPGTTAKVAAIKKLDAKGTYKLRVASKSRFENLHKKGGGAYELAPVHAKVKERIVGNVAIEVSKSGRALFPMFGADAWKQYGNEAKSSVANLVAEDGLAVSTVKVEGSVPPLENKEKADKVLAAGKKKFVDPVTKKVKAVTEPIRKKLEAQWNKVVGKAQQAWEKVTGPLSTKWKGLKADFSRKATQLVEKSGIPAARDWLLDKAVRLGTEIENKALAGISVFVKPVNWAVGVKENVDTWVDKQKKKLSNKVDQIKNEASDFANSLVDKDLRSSRKKLSEVKNEEKAGSYGFGWEDGALRPELWRRYRFASGAVWLEVGDGALKIASEGPRGDAKAQLAAWTGQLDSLEAVKRDKVKGALSAATANLGSIEGLVAQLAPLRGKDAKSVKERKRILGELGGKMARLKNPFDLAHSAFGGWGAAVEDKKKEEPKKDDGAYKTGWEDLTVRNRFLAARKRSVAKGTVIDLSIEVSETALKIVNNGPRPDTREQVAFFRARLNDIADGALRSKVADGLKAADKALGSFQAISGELRGMIEATKPAAAKRAKVVEVLLSKFEGLLDPITAALQALGSWDGMAPKTLDGGFQVPDSKRLVELLIKAGKTRVQLEKSPSMSLIKEARALWRAEAGSDEAYIRQTAAHNGDRFSGPALDAALQVDEGLLAKIAEDEKKALQVKGLAGTEQDQAARVRAEARVKQNKEQANRVKIKAKRLASDAANEWLQTIAVERNSLHQVIVAVSDRLGLARKVTNPVAEPEPPSDYQKAVTGDLKKAGGQALKLLSVFKSETKIKAHGWEFEEASAALASCGKVEVLGLSFPVKVEAINGALTIQIVGLGEIKGLGHLWSHLGPADATKAAQLTAGIGRLKGATTVFDVCASRLDAQLGTEKEDVEKRKISAAVVAHAATVAAEEVSKLAAEVGLPKLLGALFQATREQDTTERKQAGWSFSDVKPYVYPKPPRLARVGDEQHVVEAKQDGASLGLQVGEFGTARQLHTAWITQHKAEGTTKAALDKATTSLAMVLSAYEGATEEFGGAVGLDQTGKDTRKVAAAKWSSRADMVAEAVAGVGGRFGKPNNDARAEPKFLDYKVKLGADEVPFKISAKGEKDKLLTVHVGAHGTVHHLVTLYKQRLALQKAEPKTFDLLAALSKKGKAFEAAVGALAASVTAFGKAAADYEGAFGVTPEANEALRKQVAVAAEGVIEPLSKLWTDHGSPFGQDKPAGAVPTSAATPDKATPADAQGGATKGWDFAEAKAVLAAALAVRTPGGEQPLHVDLGKQPPVVLIGGTPLRSTLDTWRRWLKITPGSATRVTWIAEVGGALSKIDKAFATLGTTTDAKPESVDLRRSLALEIRGALVDIVQAYANVADKPVKHGWEFPEAKVLGREGVPPKVKFGKIQRSLYVDFVRTPPVLVLEGYPSVKAYADSWEAVHAQTSLAGSEVIDRAVWLGKTRPALAAIERHFLAMGPRTGENPADAKAREEAIGEIRSQMGVVAKAFEALNTSLEPANAQDQKPKGQAAK